MSQFKQRFRRTKVGRFVVKGGLLIVRLIRAYDEGEKMKIASGMDRFNFNDN